MERRAFLKTSGAFVCGVGAAAAITPTVRAEPAVPEGPNIIGPRKGFSPHLGTLVSMLTWMRRPIISSVEGLTTKQLDYLHDAKANTIGALLLHLAATERLYQIHTFEERPWGDWDEETKKRWLVPMNLDQQARKSIKGNDLAYYLDALKTVREQTLRELQKRDDTWLMKVDAGFPWGPTNNYCKWFHVCEHESNHNGQIKWIRGRLPS
jgi:uncharacterized damage-inducible protein DinB